MFFCVVFFYSLYFAHAEALAIVFKNRFVCFHVCVSAYRNKLQDKHIMQRKCCFFASFMYIHRKYCVFVAILSYAAQHRGQYRIKQRMENAKKSCKASANAWAACEQHGKTFWTKLHKTSMTFCIQYTHIGINNWAQSLYMCVGYSLSFFAWLHNVFGVIVFVLHHKVFIDIAGSFGFTFFFGNAYFPRTKVWLNPISVFGIPAASTSIFSSCCSLSFSIVKTDKNERMGKELERRRDDVMCVNLTSE